MRAVVTRPVEDAERIAAPLRDRGADVLFEPLLTIEPFTGVQVDATGIQAYLLTSANGVRALAAVPGVDLSIPALAVGDQTASVARELGFASVRAAEGDVTSLAALVRAVLKPDDGPLLHAAGSHVAGDLAGDLGRDGYVLRRVRLYESRAATAFSEPFKAALKAGTIDVVLLYSPRTAKTFATLAKQDDLRDPCAGVTAYCLSQAVADALGDVSFAAVRVAPRPEQDALLELFDADTKHQDR
ncbi:MAG: uroporphyrinogen-III synthase [Rhodospirillaceae bacterium]